MKAFLTGGTGFVGANLARRLVERGDEVHLLTRKTSDMWRLNDVASRLHPHEGDLTDAKNIERIIRDVAPETVFHLGAYGAYHYQQDPRLIFQTSVFGTLNLLEASRAAGVRSFVNTGSSSEYGAKDHPMAEDERIDPNSYYAVGKAAQTLLCQQFARAEKFPVLTLRLFSVYGPYEEPGRLVPTLITRALAGTDLELADPETARDFIHVDDVVDAYLAAAEHPEHVGEVFNVASGQQRTLRDIVQAVLEETGSRSRPLWNAYGPRPFDTAVWVADTRKTRERLAPNPAMALREGIRRTVGWFRAHGELAERYER